MVNTDFGTRLRDERARLGLSQTEFGELGNVKKNTQSNYESGTRMPDAAYLIRIAAAGADVLYLITGERSVQPLSNVEQQLLLQFKTLSVEQQQALLALLNVFNG